MSSFCVDNQQYCGFFSFFPHIILAGCKKLFDRLVYAPVVGDPAQDCQSDGPAGKRKAGKELFLHHQVYFTVTLKE